MGRHLFRYYWVTYIMVEHACVKCEKVFKQKSQLDAHKKRKTPCKKDKTLEKIVERKVQEALTRIDVPVVEETTPPLLKSETQLESRIILGRMEDTVSQLEPQSAQIIIADPPYNIGKDFGNDSDKQPMEDYLHWCDSWITDCLRVLRDDGTMFIYGFSEILALILARLPSGVNRRWLIWHYTNKTTPSLNFWQRSHESILVIWKDARVFNRDAVREPYTDTFIKGAAGKERKATKGRFQKEGSTETTTYTAHPGGALPRDVIKIPALAGGAGMNERVDHPTQKPLALCEKLIKSCRQEEGFVFIPFAGSGSECVAAKKLGLPFIGVEMNPDYVKIIQTRLDACS